MFRVTDIFPSDVMNVQSFSEVLPIPWQGSKIDMAIYIYVHMHHYTSPCTRLHASRAAAGRAAGDSVAGGSSGWVRDQTRSKPLQLPPAELLAAALPARMIMRINYDQWVSLVQLWGGGGRGSCKSPFPYSPTWFHPSQTQFGQVYIYGRVYFVPVKKIWCGRSSTELLRTSPLLH